MGRIQENTDRKPQGQTERDRHRGVGAEGEKEAMGSKRDGERGTHDGQTDSSRNKETERPTDKAQG